MADVNDVLDFRINNIESCPLCGQPHAEAKMRLLDEPEWRYEIECPATRRTYKARPQKEAPPAEESQT